MSEPKIKLNRYDGHALVELIKHDSLRYKGNEAWMVHELGKNEEFEIYFETKMVWWQAQSLKLRKA